MTSIDESFDTVFSHARLLHLREPGKALQEMRRVLKPGGPIGIRNDDQDGYLITPPDPLLRQGWDLLVQDVQDKGRNARGAKHQRAWLNDAGFVRGGGLCLLRMLRKRRSDGGVE